MSYFPTECIFDLIAASGPQEALDMLCECCTQCTDMPGGRMPAAQQERVKLVTAALTALEQAGIIEQDGSACYDLTSYGHCLNIDNTYWSRARNRTDLHNMRQDYAQRLNTHSKYIF